MEEYDDVGSNALIAFNASDATDASDKTTGGQEQEVSKGKAKISSMNMINCRTDLK